MVDLGDVTAVVERNGRMLFAVALPTGARAAVVAGPGEEQRVVGAIDRLMRSTSVQVTCGRLWSPQEVSAEGDLVPRPDLRATVERLMGPIG